MKINVKRDQILDTLSLASRFTSAKLSSSVSLQGILMRVQEKRLNLYSTNLSSYFHTSIPVETDEKLEAVIEPRKIIEFINLLNPGELVMDIKEKQITFTQNKTKGNFPLMVMEEFPLPPEITEKPQTIATDFLSKNLPMVLFTASQDETRPVLTGVNFTHQDEDLTIVSTDGFRLSILKQKKQEDIPSMIVPADFMNEIIKNAKEEKEISFAFSRQEKLVKFIVGKHEFYSRLIEGEFPPFERVIPAEKASTAVVDRAELLRNVKLISVFARDFSHVVVCEFKKEGLYVRPKKEGSDENSAFQEIEMDGEEQRVAFNYKFLLDFLNHVDTETVTVEILRPDAPVVFKVPKNNNFIHIIMPVRIQE